MLCFIGRLADWILKDRDDVLNVFITAPDEAASSYHGNTKMLRRLRQRN